MDTKTTKKEAEASFFGTEAGRSVPLARVSQRAWESLADANYKLQEEIFRLRTEMRALRDSAPTGPQVSLASSSIPRFLKCYYKEPQPKIGREESNRELLFSVSVPGDSTTGVSLPKLDVLSPNCYCEG